MACSQCPTPITIKRGFYKLVWKCSYCTEADANHRFTLGSVIIYLYLYLCLPRYLSLSGCRTMWTHHYFGISDHEEKSGEKASSGVKSELVPSSQPAEPVASSASPTMQESQAPGLPVAPEPEIEIAINNVVCSFSVRCHLNLRKVATEGVNVIYKRENGVRPLVIRIICILEIREQIDQCNAEYKHGC